MKPHPIGVQREIHALYQDALHAKLLLDEAIEKHCPGEHAYIQYRDGRKPWCKHCLYQIDGMQAARMVRQRV